MKTRLSAYSFFKSRVKVIHGFTEAFGKPHRLRRAATTSADVSDKNICRIGKSKIPLPHTAVNVAFGYVFNLVGTCKHMVVCLLLIPRPHIGLVLTRKEQDESYVRVAHTEAYHLSCRYGIKAESSAGKEIAAPLGIRILNGAKDEGGKSRPMLILYLPMTCKSAGFHHFKLPHTVILSRNG